ncbi:mitochondrial ribosomal protein L45 [Megachile rotundata]|uniref:mitochondrial ribosomal protein L45 n=1 Tax=Megachile rotundata TaxID=143995 RepID=UPI000258E11D|nr:PREDICTED: probable 39S ribosomal protein L45, mitochondrial [Megachile rotundata]
MMLKYKCAVCIFGRYAQNNLPLALAPINFPLYNTTVQCRGIKKHYNQKFRKERAQKFIKIELPKYDKDGNLTRDAERTYMKKAGILPNKEWNERPLLISSTTQIFESYIVPEGDGKFSAITTSGAKQKVELIEKKSKSYLSIRKIRSYDDNFSTKTFGEEAFEIYKKAHEALANKDEDELLQYVTEHAYPMMTHNTMDKTIVWKFLESLEPPRIVHARNTSLISKENEFGQVTVRFHTQQILCIYDRFGRVLMGSETVKKDVLDYVVFEKHLSNVYGKWRIHAKIIPKWMTPEQPSTKTYIMSKEKPEDPPTAVESVAQTVPPESLDAKL